MGSLFSSEKEEVKFDSAKSFHPAIFEKKPVQQTLFRLLAHQSQAIPVQSQNVSIIQEPSDFYDTIIEGIEKSQHRIYLSSLYLGIGKHEQRIAQALDTALSKNPNLNVSILLDCLRGTRGTTNSTTILQPLILKYPKQFQLQLYHTPELRGLLKLVLPARMNEIVGLQHMKLYIFDHNLLISGANLSDWYFVDRQDRYMFFQNETMLTNYYVKLIDTVRQFCYHVNAKGELHFPHPSVNPLHNPQEFKIFANKLLLPFTNPTSIDYNTVSDTYVFPTLQLGQVGLRQDEKITCSLLEYFSIHPQSVFLASAYFNLTSEYMTRIMQSAYPIHIITAHPRANGFFTATGISKYIPDAYNALEYSFMNRVKKNVQVYEYQRPKWTFHAKGLWYYAPDETYPCLTMIGSPNFGQRSVDRDLESQLVLLTSNQELQTKLHQECQYLYKDALKTNIDVFKQQERKVGVFMSLVTKWVQKFL